MKEFKSGDISRAKQLTLHSALGCGAALAGGGDCASGALSGVSGELAGEYVKDNLYPGQTTSSLTGQQKTVIKELGGLAGGLSAIFTGNAVGLSESDIADNIFSGQRIGKNAVENNFLRQEVVEEHQEIMWLDGKISDENYNAYKDQELKNAVLAVEVLAGATTLGAGAAVVQSGNILVKQGIKAGVMRFGSDAIRNVGVNTVNGIVSSSAAALVSGADVKTGLISVGTGTLVNVVTGGLADKFQPEGKLKQFVTAVVTNALSAASSSYLTTRLTYPNATNEDYIGNFGKSLIVSTPGSLLVNGMRFGTGIAAKGAVNFGMGMLNASTDTAIIGAYRGYEHYKYKQSIMER
ncbi:MAG: VENN motif pre-toxin domain-containing protein [Alphaproteobacteria bacterium]|jgi:hypothetical protein|nr:VENN motif pre-toxin domain-containing protein [Alphaproteobacteria bacterium]